MLGKRRRTEEASCSLSPRRLGRCGRVLGFLPRRSRFACGMGSGQVAGRPPRAELGEEEPRLGRGRRRKGERGGPRGGGVDSGSFCILKEAPGPFRRRPKFEPLSAPSAGNPGGAARAALSLPTPQLSPPPSRGLQGASGKKIPFWASRNLSGDWESPPKVG